MASTSAPPYVAVIFTSRRTPDDNCNAEMADATVARSGDGCDELSPNAHQPTAASIAHIAGSRAQNDGTLPVAEHAKSAIGAGNSATSPANGPNRAIRASSPVSLFPLSVSAHD
jgi:hypothetical protein